MSDLSFFQKAPNSPGFPVIGRTDNPGDPFLDPSRWVENFPTIDKSQLTAQDFGPGSPFGNTAPAGTPQSDGGAQSGSTAGTINNQTIPVTPGGVSVGDITVNSGSAPDPSAGSIPAGTGSITFDPNTGLAFGGGGNLTSPAGDAAGAVAGAATGAIGAATGGLTGLAGIPDAIKTAGTTIAKGIGDQISNTFNAAENYLGRGAVILIAVVIFLAGVWFLVPRGAKESIASGAMGGGGRIPRSGGGGSRRPAMIRPGEAGYVSPAQLAAGRAAHGIT